MPTPVWFAAVAEDLYIRSASTGGKVKRIRRNPRVLVAPAIGNGNAQP